MIISIPIILLLVGCVALCAKWISIRYIRERIHIARQDELLAYVRSGTTLLNLLYIGLVVMVLLMGINATAFFMEPQPQPITWMRAVRGVLYVLAYSGLALHAIYGAYRYNGDTQLFADDNGQTRDEIRDEERDVARDEVRDPARDEGRDTGRDVPRDIARDVAHDEATGITHEESDD